MPTPTEINLKQKSHELNVIFDDGQEFVYSCEYLRVNSPSAEVQGHGGQGGVKPVDKQDVNIIGIEPVGNYAVKLIFDDGHDSGIYSWDVLYKLGTNQ